MMQAVATTALASDPSAWHLLARVELVGAQVAAAVARRRAMDDVDEGEFRGLYVSDAHVDALLGGGAPRSESHELIAPLVADVEAVADQMEARGARLPLRRLARSCGLDAADVALLIVALAPEIEPTFQPLYAYLQDDATRGRAGPALALELVFGPAGPLSERGRLGPAAPLVKRHLVQVERADGPFWGRSLTVGDRVVGHLLGDAPPDPVVAVLAYEPAAVRADPAHELCRAIATGSELVYVRDEAGTGLGAAAAACLENGRAALVLDLRRNEPEDDATVARAIVLDAVLSERVVVAGPVDALDSRPKLLRLLAGAPVPVVLVGTRTWDTGWSPRTPLRVDAPTLAPAERARLWEDTVGADPGFDTGAATAQFRLGPDQILSAVRAARVRSSLEGRPLTVDGLQRAAREQSSSGLERLARRIEPLASWEDLVVAKSVADALRGLTERVRHRERVLVEWGIRGAGGARRGVAALFAGPSGTGKTMSAEVIAGDLGLDLYVVDLASVVDKYIGETEKNLERIFDEASSVNGILLFDEADALFGKRSGVEDARDRYANIEVAYLLQRMESFDGVAILTSNLRGNLDDAFARRLDAVVELPMPDEAARLRLWEANLPPAVPRSSDVDLEFLARFELSGGNVHNACLDAAFAAAAGDRSVVMTDLVRGVAAEYSKLGHMCVEAEFEPYYDLIGGP